MIAGKDRCLVYSQAPAFAYLRNGMAIVSCEKTGVVRGQ